MQIIEEQSFFLQSHMKKNVRIRDSCNARYADKMRFQPICKFFSFPSGW